MAYSILCSYLLVQGEGLEVGGTQLGVEPEPLVGEAGKWTKISLIL